ncbi:MAG: LLM class flavin-dependent oxidoreductase [Micropruina sp.]|uniref:LLM class flavin-dependent oxidoreductase n=1 Tax=Micropruina sp. TaxID=2737536 RepID=UPI0039E5C22B
MTKKIGFLSFGHHRDVPGSRVRTAGDALRDHIELAVAAEAAGLDGAWLRVHHFDHSLASPFPLLAAMAARTSTIDVGTGVIDLRYENPLYLAEEAAATDLIGAGRLQLGISRGSPESAADGQAAFGYRLADGEDWARVTRQRADLFRRAIAGEPVAHSHRAAAAGRGPDLPIQPLSPGLNARIWWGSGSHATGVWAGEQGYNLLSSTLLLADDGRPFHRQQADQVRDYRTAFAAAGHTAGGRTAVTRSVFPITTAEDHSYFGLEGGGGDGVGFLDGTTARSGPTFAGSPDRVAEDLRADEAVSEADYVLFALPSMLGVEYNAHLFENLVAVARELGWKD